MLIGDVLRVISSLVSNIMYSKAFMIELIILDISYNLILVILVYFLFQKYGLNGLGYSYLIANIFVILYVFTFYFNIKNLLYKKRKNIC